MLEPVNLARGAYAAYGKVTEFKNFRGEPMPEFDDLPVTIQSAWLAACSEVLRAANDEREGKPQRMFGANEVTAEGLKSISKIAQT